MKTKPVYLLFYGLIGAAISLATTSISQWGKATPLKEGAFIFFTLVCIAIMHIIWFRDIRKAEELNRNTNKRPGNLFVLWAAMAIGIATSTFILNIR